MNGDVITTSDDLIHVANQFDSLLSRSFDRHEWVITYDFHFETQRTFCDREADASESNHGQRLPCQLSPFEFIAIPLARLHARIGCGDVARQGHHHRDGVLGGAGRVPRRGVHDHDSFASRCW